MQPGSISAKHEAKRVSCLFLSLPLLVNAIPFAADRLFLGAISTTALASMQISATLFFSLFSIIIGLSNGSPRLSLVIGIIVAVLSFMGIDALCALFPMASLEVKEAAQAYLMCTIPALPIYLLVHAFGGAKNAMHIAFQGACLHVALAAFLIFGPFSMGVSGAALASVAAALYQLVFLLRSASGRNGASLSSFCERVIQYGSYIVLTIMVGLLGDSAMAAQQCLLVLGVLCFIVLDSLSKNGVQLSTVIVGAASISFWLMPSFFMRLFTSDPEVLALGSSSLQLFALIQPLTFVALLLPTSRMAGMIGTGVRLFAAYYFAFVLGLGLCGIWFGVAADWFVRLLQARAVFKRTAALKS